MVGRTEELGRLRAALARAGAGEPTAVVVAGEAGIGKTRLVDAFAATIGPAAQVVRGGCVPLTERLLAYAPVVELLRAVHERVGTAALLELAGAHRGVLTRLVPELAGSASDEPGNVVDDRGRLFGALRGVLERLAAGLPVVAVLEDLHWADPSTRALLAYLVHDLLGGRSRVLLVCTYRTDDVSPSHPLRPLLAELDRRGVPRIELDRFTLADTEAQVAGVLGRPLDGAVAAIAERVHSRCDGNPFLVEELLAAGPDVELLPEVTRDILLQRVRRLSKADQQLLHMVAVAGRAVDHRLLARVVATPEDRLLVQLRQAVEEQILVVAGDGYAFRHSLVAEAVAAEAMPGERIRAHRAYAEALTALDGSAAELAHHWCAAGDPVRGLIASVDAGLAAERLFAQSEAGHHFDRAIQLWYEAPPARTEVALDLVDLCGHGAQAAYLDGDISRAIALLRKALAELDADSDPLRAGMLHERLGRYLWANADSEAESIGAYERAVHLVPDLPTAERARVLTGLAGALVYADRPDSGTWCREALRVARAAGARGEEGQALGRLGYCRAMAGDVTGGLEDCRQALVIAARFGHADDLYRAYSGLVGVLRMAGRTAEAASVALEGVEAARQRGAQRTYGNLLLGDAVEAMILLGRWDEAEALLPAHPDVLAHGTAVIATNLWLSAANLHIWRGRFDLAQRFLDASSTAYASRGHGHVRTMLSVHQAELCLWQGQFAEAARWVRDELDLVGHSDFTSLLSRLVLAGLRAEAGLARHADLPRLTALLDQLSARPDPPPDAAAIIAMSWAERARAQGESAVDRWAEAAGHWAALDLAWPLAYTRWRQAEALLAYRPKPARRADAVALAEAHAISTRLGAQPLRREIEALARRTRLLSALAHAESPAARAKADPAGLTPREHEVLGLLGTGATNRQIARTLLISEKTVSIHVSHILTKLHAANRSEAAAIANRRGLLRPSPASP